MFSVFTQNGLNNDQIADNTTTDSTTFDTSTISQPSTTSVTSSTTITQSQSSESSETTQTETSSSETMTTTPDPDPIDYDLVLVEIHNEPSAALVGVRNAGDGSGKLYLINQRGTIIILEKNTTTYDTSTFLDIQSSVDYGGEKGLLGLAFHPNYENNGFFYVYYSAHSPLRSVVSRFTVDNIDPDKANLTSELIIMEIGQPDHNHNGGDIAFGPNGYLYIALGDGGGSWDAYGNGQNLETLLGSILRIDIDNTSSYGYYAIPATNPYKDNVNNYKEEIFAHGIRNPWRMSFDTLTGDLWVGDVGQGLREEVSIVENGKNYGWPDMEGFECYIADCVAAGYVAPIHDYNRTEGTVVTGGYVYRANNVTELQDLYVFADYSFGTIWTLDTNNLTSQSTKIFDSGLSVSAFGTDEEGELYLTTLQGKLFQFQQVPSS